MSFWNSGLIKTLEKGELPEVKAQVSIEKSSLVALGIVLVAVAVSITLLVFALKGSK